MGRYAGARRRATTARSRLCSRTERDVTVAFPELRGWADEYADMLLDGEVVSMQDGIPSFAALAERFHVTDRAGARRCSPSPHR